MADVATRLIGDMPVFPIGLGGASWSFADHPGGGDPRPPDDERAIRTIHAALDSGVTLIDTARAYTTADHPGHSEALIARAIATHPAGAQAIVATKGGHYREGGEFPIDASPDAIRRHCETSLRVLGRDRIDLYQLHKPDPDVPVRTSMTAFAALRDEGLVRHVGVSNVTLAQLEEAMSVVPIVSVANHFSPQDQSDRALLDHCAEHGIAYLAYSPLGGGAWPHPGGAARLADAFPAAAALAAREGISIQRLALAWLLSLSPAMIPICGASRPESIRDSALAAATILPDEGLSAFPPGSEELR